MTRRGTSMAVTPARLVLAGIGLVLAAHSASLAAGRFVRQSAPAVAETQFADDAAAIRIALPRQSQRGFALPRDEAFALARRRLVAEPLDARALALMSQAADPMGRSEEAARYARLANRASRRQPLAQLVMIADRLRAGDVPGAIDNLDAIMRARPEARELVFPYARQTLPDPQVRQIFAGHIAKGSPWVFQFLSNAVEDKAAAPHVADILVRARASLPAEQMKVYGPLFIARMLDNGAYDGARSVVGLVPGGDARSLADASFTRATTGTSLGVAGWQVADNPDASATFVQPAGNAPPVLSIYAPGGANAVVAERRLLLPAGRHRIALRGSVSEGNTASAALPLSIACVDGAAGTILAEADILPRLDAGYTGSFVVPADCRLQRLAISIEVPFSAPALDVTVARLTITPAT